MRILYAIIILSILSTAAVSDLQYRLTSGGKPIGIAEIAQTPRGAGQLFKGESKIAEGTVKKTIKEMITVEGDFGMTDYTLSISGTEGEFRATAGFKNGVTTLKGKAGSSPIEGSFESLISPSPWLEDISVAGAIALLNRANLNGVGSKAQFEAILPLKGEVSKINLSAVEFEKNLLVVETVREGGWQWKAYWDIAKRELVRLSVNGQFEAELIVAVESNESESKVLNYHPLTAGNLADADLIARVGSVKNLKAGLAFNLSPDDFDRLYLNHFSQEFAGEVSETKIMGLVEVKNIGHKVTNTPNWPLFYPLTGYDETYILPERGIDSDNPKIIARAENTVKPAKTLWDAARAINLWVHRNISYDESQAGALETFNSEKGDSRSKALLCTALCRAAGIPARVVSGLIWADGPIDHAWVEVYLGDKAGWGPIDPTFGEADRISAAHISLWLGAGVPPVLAKDVLLENVVIE